MMLIKRIIERDVKNCRDCPYSAMFEPGLIECEKMCEQGKGFPDTIVEYNGISENCPFLLKTT